MARRRRERAGGTAERAAHAADDGIRRLRRRHLRRHRARQRSRCRTAAASSRVSGSGGSTPSAAMLAAGAIERPLVFGDNDRPGVMLAGAARTYINRFAVAPGRRARRFHEQRRRLADSDRCDSCRHQRRGGHRQPRERVADTRRRPCRRARVSCSAAPWYGASGAPVIQAVEVREASGRIPRIRVRRTGDVRRLVADCPSRPVISAASQRGANRSRRSCRARCRRAWRSPARPSARCRLAAGLASGRDAGAGSSAARAATRQPSSPLPKADDEPATTTALWHVTGGRGQGLRRLPERRDDRGHRPRQPRGLSLGRAAQALHDARHGDRPGQDVERQRSGAARGAAGPAHRRGRHDAQSGRRSRRSPSARSPAITAARSSAPTRLSPLHEWAGKQGAVFVETGAWLRAAVVPARRRRTGSRAATREVKAVRSARRRDATSRRSARSTSRGRTPRRCSTASTATPSRRSPSAARATA